MQRSSLLIHPSTSKQDLAQGTGSTGTGLGHSLPRSQLWASVPQKAPRRFRAFAFDYVGSCRRRRGSLLGRARRRLPFPELRVKLHGTDPSRWRRKNRLDLRATMAEYSMGFVEIPRWVPSRHEKNLRDPRQPCLTEASHLRPHLRIQWEPEMPIPTASPNPNSSSASASGWRLPTASKSTSIWHVLGENEKSARGEPNAVIRLQSGHFWNSYADMWRFALL